MDDLCLRVLRIQRLNVLNGDAAGGVLGDVLVGALPQIEQDCIPFEDGRLAILVQCGESELLLIEPHRLPDVGSRKDRGGGGHAPANGAG